MKKIVIVLMFILLMGATIGVAESQGISTRPLKAGLLIGILAIGALIPNNSHK